MIRQHFLQQQRLNYNHDRLLERYQHLLSPQVSEFRAFGASSLPGRNYEEYLRTMNCNPYRKDSLVALSRAGIGSSSETYRWLGNGASEILPRNISSVMKHTRQQPIPIVHTEKFEPVQVYEHPVFGPTPAYIRPIYNETQLQRLREFNDNNSDKDSTDDEYDNEVRSHTSGNIHLRNDHSEERKTSSISDNDNDGEFDDPPLGYISYKQWKTKYENLIPVNPLLFNIYTHRPNGSINSYGQSLYTSLNHIKPHGLSGRDERVTTPTLSDIDSVLSEIPRETSSLSSQQYHRLQPHSLPTTIKTRPLEPIRAGDGSDLSDDELSPPDSPVPYLSRNKPNLMTSKSVPSTIPSTSIKSPSVPTTRITSSLSPTIGITSSSVPTTGITSSLLPTLGTTSSSAPTTGTTSLPSAVTLETTSSPSATKTETTLSPSASTMGITSTLNTPSGNNTTGASIPPTLPTNASNIPPAPPISSYLTSTTSTHSYQTPSSSLTIPSSSITPSVPKALSSSGSSATYQVPSNASVSLTPAPPLPSSISTTHSTKAVTFGGSSSIPITNNDVSSSSDSEDEEKQKRRRKKTRQAQAAQGLDVDSSSSDD
ncbi:unnamed protein product [Rotaria sp. Silwood2]|nr:unnamed protein product [Rotaria sp. Silwood2]CAF2910199.1 unnamed protein product [Rotaria sp. Silwood2]CAF4008439.1 unnamed protein product [Rotaria sp. Silwood2]CAF4055700.1 unnamed protein product [Rotaria sp. Silwood2]